MISYAYFKLFISSVFIQLKRVCTRNNLSHNFVRKRDKTLNLFTFGEGQHPFPKGPFGLIVGQVTALQLSFLISKKKTKTMMQSHRFKSGAVFWNAL